MIHLLHYVGESICWRINLLENQPAVTAHISDLTGVNETLIMAQNMSEMGITCKSQSLVIFGSTYDLSDFDDMINLFRFTV